MEGNQSKNGAPLDLSSLPRKHSRAYSTDSSPMITPHSTSSSQVGSTTSSTRRQRAKKTSAKTKMRNGVNIIRLQEWRADHRNARMDEEDCRQEIALAKMKTQVVANSMVIRLQSWARMMKCRYEFLEYIGEKVYFKWRFFRGWYVTVRTERLYRRSFIYRPFVEWALETAESIRLSNLALSIFKKAVNNSKLTPQAVMAYFSKSDYDGKITERELNSVRRLILKRLFAAWLFEAKLLRIHRFKAGQILTRMFRRTFGNLSQRELLVLTLHVWHRLAAVNTAYRRGDPQPHFTQPYIKQWGPIVQNITVKRIKKIRAQDSSRQLLKMRGFKFWLKAISNDNTPDNEGNTMKAEAHYVETLFGKVFHVWNKLTRERGRNLRRREKCFFAW